MAELIKKLRTILTSSQKRKFAWLILVVVIMATLEVIGIAAIMPFMMLVSQPDAIEQNRWLHWAFEQAGFDSTRQFLFAVGAIILLLLAARNVAAVVAKWLQYRFAWHSAHIVSLRLLRAYVYQPYEYFLQHNSSNLGKQVLTEVNLFVRFTLLPCAEIVAQTCIAVVIIALLLVVDTTLALTVLFVLGGVYAAIYAVARRYMGVIGRERFEADRLRFQTANELLSGIKSVKIRSAEDFFVDRFRRASAHYTSVQPKYEILSQVPRHFVELLAFGGILLIILFLLGTSKEFNEIIPLLSLYALAGFRLLPALQNLFKSVSAIRFHAPAVDTIYSDLCGAVGPKQSTSVKSKTPDVSPVVPVVGPTPEISRADMNGQNCAPKAEPSGIPMLQRQITVKSLTFRFAGGDEWILKDVDLVIPRHARVAIVGPTGSGKTTLVDLLIGLLKPYRGGIYVDGLQITEDNVSQWRKVLGYVPQDVVLYDDTFARNIAYGVPDAEVDMNRVKRVAEIACVDDVITEFPKGYHTPVGDRGIRMSGGQRQRIGLARALYHEPEILVLDEATNSLDGITEEAVLLALSKNDRPMTIITIAHRLATVRDHDRIYLLKNGRISAEGTYDDLVSSNKTFREMAKLSV